MRLVPDPSEYPAGRLFCLDLVRGLDIFYLTVLTPWTFWRELQKLLPFDTSGQLWWNHQLTAFVTPDQPLYGFNITDFAQPLFIFVCGAAVPFAIPRRLSPEGRATAAFWKHVLGRVAMLWIFGALIRGLLVFDLEKSQFCWYADTLQTIAVSYLGASLAQLISKRVWRFVLALGLIAIFGFCQAQFGDYTRLGNFSRLVDKTVFAWFGGHEKDYSYAFTTLPWLAMGIIGSLATDVLRRSCGCWRKVAVLTGWGVASCVLGLALRFACGIPMIRYIYTVSFIFEVLGLSVLVVTAFYVLTDIWKLRRGTGLFLLFGQCSLAAWMIDNFFGGGLDAFAQQICVGLPNLIGTDAYQLFAQRAVRGCLVIALVSLWWRYRTLKSQARVKGESR